MQDADNTTWTVFTSPPRSPKNTSYSVQLGAGSRIAIRAAIRVDFPDSRDAGARLLLISPDGKQTEVAPPALRRTGDSLAIRQMEFTPDVGGAWQLRVEGVQHGWHEVHVKRLDKPLPMRYGLEETSVSRGEKVPVCAQPVGMAASGATLLVNHRDEVPLTADGSGIYATEIEAQPGDGMRFAFHAVIDGTQAQFWFPVQLRVH